MHGSGRTLHQTFPAVAAAARGGAALALVTVAWTAGLASAKASGPLATFGGEVTRGERFEREIAPALFFRLVPIEDGWTVWVGTAATDDPDFSAVVTPPFHGVNTREIAGWHFRNADNSGPNAPGPLNVNAPGAVRDFVFVRTESDRRAALEALRRVLWPADEAERQAAQPALEALMDGATHGRLTIVDLQLGNVDPGARGQQAWIERMRFRVEFPAP